MTKPKIKNNVVADIRRFTGFIAPDGTTHDSIKKATDYTRDLKIKAALADFALVIPGANEGVTTDDEDGRGNPVIYVEDLPAFLLAHKADILAAFAQDVLMRAPRRPVAAVKAAEPAQWVAPAVSKPVFTPAASIDDSLAELGSEADEMTLV